MAESAVSFLLEQLSVVLRDERNLLGGLKQEVQSINDELVQMREFLRVADAKEETDNDLKEWIGQLREISFDFEDVLDEYMLRIGRHGNTDGFCGCLKKLGSLIKNWKDRHQIASDIKTIKHRLENVAKCQEKYKNMDANMDQGSSSTIPKVEEYDGRGDALFLEDDEVVGIEKPKKQLLGWIWSKQSGLEVISVVGAGGLGKTTLAKKVYDVESVKSYFDRHVWLAVSDYKKDDIVKLHLLNLIKKLKEEVNEPLPQGLNDMDIDDMRNFIKEFLKGKKYIIVLDDVWKQSTWKAIKCALPTNGGHGCVIITTRDNEISNLACIETNHVYNLEALPELESKVLFYRKAFPRTLQELDPCPSHLKEFAENILKRCEGLPLAIVVIGGLLATKKNRVEDWALFNRSLSHELEAGSLARIFSLSYNDLPYYLKYCFSYLSIFPEDFLVEKENIVRLWIAEGFVQPEQHKTLEEVAEKYLNELCSRSLIQVANKNIDGRVREFRIHDLLRDYITSKAREHNIVTAYDGGENQWPNKIRRLAIQSSGSFSVDTNNFEHLRSLLLLSSGDIEMDMIQKLVSRSRVLKVLELRGAPMEIIPDSVFKLYHLKHLCLRNTSVKVIPTWIKDLRNLETLDLKNTGVTELPKGILNLQKLRHLLVYKYKYPARLYKAPFSDIQSCRVPCDIGSHLRSLQKLCCVDADEVGDIKIVREVGKLTQLRRLGIAKLRSGNGRELCSSIAKLTSLRSLRIDSMEEGEELDLDYSLSSIGLPFLRLLHLCGRLERVPQWIPSLHGLATLFLRWSKLREDPLIWIQDLPNLTHLVIQHACVEGLTFQSHRFQNLKELKLMEMKCMKWVKVEKGSLPSLGDWRMHDCELLMELPQGIEHLTNLQYLGFYDMPNEFRKGVVKERTRLASVGRVRFLTKADDGSWRLIRRL